MYGVTEPKEKAGRGGHRGPAATVHRRHQSYPSSRRLSTAAPKKVLLHDDSTAAALGAVVLYAIARDLPRRERETAWALAERWASELVEARHSDVLVGVA